MTFRRCLSLRQYAAVSALSVSTPTISTSGKYISRALHPMRFGCAYLQNAEFYRFDSFVCTPFAIPPLNYRSTPYYPDYSIINCGIWGVGKHVSMLIALPISAPLYRKKYLKTLCIEIIVLCLSNFGNVTLHL